MDLLLGAFEERLRKSISFAWSIFSEKVGFGSLEINKEASMQLQYAQILQQVASFICFKKDENIKIELETGVKTGGKIDVKTGNTKDKYNEIDLVLIGEYNNQKYKIAVEMKCYKENTAWGTKRGGYNLFMHDVYEDLFLLERYMKESNYDCGVALVMTDYKHLVSPEKKAGKCWDIYDISNNKEITPISDANEFGDFTLERNYKFIWKEIGTEKKYWFLENEGYL